MNKIIVNVRKELKANIDSKYKEGITKFFKGQVIFLGVRIPNVEKVGKKYFKEIKHLDKKEIFSLSEELMKTPYNEETHMGFWWAYGVKDQFTKNDFNTFETWLKKYVTDWGTCDDFCTRTLAYFFSKYPQLIAKTKKWRKSKNMWARRASAVIFIGAPWRKNRMDKKDYLKHVFETADTLMMDKEDLVQKGYGWMLKVASNQYQKDVFNYVMKHKDKMPRTSLRYAIEKMPQVMRKRAMAK